MAQTDEHLRPHDPHDYDSMNIPPNFFLLTNLWPKSRILPKSNVKASKIHNKRRIFQIPLKHYPHNATCRYKHTLRISLYRQFSFSTRTIMSFTTKIRVDSGITRAHLTLTYRLTGRASLLSISVPLYNLPIMVTHDASNLIYTQQADAARLFQPAYAHISTSLLRGLEYDHYCGGTL
jgi:hypothetical protein